jgi:hypothetical protein
MPAYHYTSKKRLIVLPKQFSKFGRNLIAFSLAFFFSSKKQMAIDLLIIENAYRQGA